MKRILCFSLFVMIFAAVGQVQANTTISTLPFPVIPGPLPEFGESAVATCGQTVTVPAIDSVLDSFSFWLDDDLQAQKDYVDFAAYVMAWDGDMATGPILWQSLQQTTTNNGGVDGDEEFTFNTGGLALTPGAKYVLFLSASNFFNNVPDQATMPFGSNSYLGGRGVVNNNGDDFSALTTTSWGRAQVQALISRSKLLFPQSQLRVLSCLAALAQAWSAGCGDAEFCSNTSESTCLGCEQTSHSPFSWCVRRVAPNERIL